jgi:hypothetical protein
MKIKLRSRFGENPPRAFADFSAHKATTLREPPVFPGVRSQFFYVCGFEFIAFVRAIRVAALRQLY